MPKKQRIYLYKSSISEFNLDFYQSYDEQFLLNKARSLMVIADNQEKFQELISQSCTRIDGDPLLCPQDIDKRFIDSLRAEVYFTAFHQFECFFALLIAAYQELPHWLYLTTYSNDELDEKIAAFINDDIGKLTEGQETNINAFLEKAVYSNPQFPDNPEVASYWQKNLDNVHWLIKRCAEKFSGAEYNAYKHGLRVKTGGSYFSLAPVDKDTLEPVEDSKNVFESLSHEGITFLELKDRQEDDQSIVRTVYRTHKHTSAYESIVYLENMARLLHTMKNTRLLAITGETHAQICTFEELNRDEIYRLTPSLNSFSMVHQAAPSKAV